MSLITFDNTYAPGVYVTPAAAPLPSASLSSTGNCFAVGLSLRGPVGVPIALTSKQDFAILCGGPATYSPMSDAVEVFFASGGQTMFFSRVVGPASTSATVTLKDRAATPLNTLVVTSNGAGLDGNNLSVGVIAGAITGSFAIQVTYSGVIVETSPPLITVSDAVNWGTLNPPASGTLASKYVVITSAGSVTPAPNNIPALAAATPLVGGADDNTNASDTQFIAALGAFGSDYGPGQVTAPGRATDAVHIALVNHGQATNRFALCDPALGANAAALATAAQAVLSGAADASYGTLLSSYILWPGVPTGTPAPAWARQVPPSTVIAGLIARNDARYDANVAAAGDKGQSGIAVGLNTAFPLASDRAALNAAGVSVLRQIRQRNNAVQLYGYVTLTQDPRWTDMANARFRMQLVSDCQNVGQGFFGSQIDGAGVTLSAFNGALSAVLAGYYAKGSLYGATPAAAFQVTTGPPINNAATATNRQLNAVLQVRMSPSAQFVDILIVKYLASQVLPA